MILPGQIYWNKVKKVKPGHSSNHVENNSKRRVGVDERNFGKQKLELLVQLVYATTLNFKESMLFLLGSETAVIDQLKV